MFDIAEMGGIKISAAMEKDMHKRRDTLKPTDDIISLFFPETSTQE
jgi:hypothetical protein